MDPRELTANLLREWCLPDVVIQAAFHYENPDAAGFADGSRVQTLTHCLAFASAQAQRCMVDDEARWSLLPALSDADRGHALHIGERVRALLESQHFSWGKQRRVQTVSVGIAVIGSTDSDSTELIKAADAALYQAKKQGRKRVVAGA